MPGWATPTPTQVHTGHALLASSCPAIPLGGRQGWEAAGSADASHTFPESKLFQL